MKNLLSIFIVLAVVFTACKKDKEEPTNPAPTPLTIVASDFANAGDTIVMNVDSTNLSGFTLTAGQNIVWDFTTLAPDFTDTTVFLNPSATQGAQYFAAISNMALRPEDDPNVCLYLNKTNDKVEGVGFWANFQGTEVHPMYTDKPIMMKFPFSYNSNYKDSAYLTDVVNLGPGQYAKLEMIQLYDIQVDGVGTIKLPNNKTYQVIRDKRTEIQHFNIYMGFTQNGPWTPLQQQKDTVYSYNFYAKNKKWNVASVRVNNFTNNVINRVEYLKE